MNIIIRFIENKDELERILDLRYDVFTGEQNIPTEIEHDNKEDEAEHIIVFDDDKLIGCARIRFIDSRAKLERIIVVKGYRGRGIGNKIMDFLIQHAKSKDIKEAYLIGQSRLKPFYGGKGFKTRGEEFIIAEIPHFEFYLPL